MNVPTLSKIVKDFYFKLGLELNKIDCPLCGMHAPNADTNILLKTVKYSSGKEIALHVECYCSCGFSGGIIRSFKID